MASVTGAALAALLQTCAPNVEPATMHAIVTVESGGDALAIGDNTGHRRYSPRSYQEAVRTAMALIAQGHSVDLGIAQVNSGNLAGYRVTPAAMFLPCQNLITASAILTGAYRWAAATYSDPRRALWGAVSAYNTGSLYAGARYVNLVVAASRQAPLVPSIEILTGVSAPVRVPAPTLRAIVPPRPKPTPDFAFSTDARRY